MINRSNSWSLHCYHYCSEASSGNDTTVTFPFWPGDVERTKEGGTMAKKRKNRKKKAKSEKAMRSAMVHTCQFEPDGDACSKEATRQFRIVYEHLSDHEQLVEKLNVCDECFPLAKKLWEENHAEWTEEPSK
jgi:hypothetical protein